MKELPYTRQQQILERLNKYDCVKIDQLAQDLHVSQMTIYRDIRQEATMLHVLRFSNQRMTIRSFRKDTAKLWLIL